MLLDEEKLVVILQLKDKGEASIKGAWRSAP